ncbi:MAG: hypothetical protein M1823_006515, partial [Watsoniomyces obsoletus]
GPSKRYRPSWPTWTSWNSIWIHIPNDRGHSPSSTDCARISAKRSAKGLICPRRAARWPPSQSTSRRPRSQRARDRCASPARGRPRVHAGCPIGQSKQAREIGRGTRATRTRMHPGRSRGKTSGHAGTLGARRSAAKEAADAGSAGIRDTSRGIAGRAAERARGIAQKTGPS